MVKYFCPVCHRPVNQTPGHSICGHFDRALSTCEGSYEPFRIALMVDETRNEPESPRKTPDPPRIPKWLPRRRQKGAQKVAGNAGI